VKIAMLVFLAVGGNEAGNRHLADQKVAIRDSEESSPDKEIARCYELRGFGVSRNRRLGRIRVVQVRRGRGSMRRQRSLE